MVIMAVAELVWVQDPGSSAGSPTWVKGPSIWAILWYFHGHALIQGNVSEMEWLGLELVPIWDTDTSGCAFTCYAMARSPNIYFYLMHRVCVCIIYVYMCKYTHGYYILSRHVWPFYLLSLQKLHRYYSYMWFLHPLWTPNDYGLKTNYIFFIFSDLV